MDRHKKADARNENEKETIMTRWTLLFALAFGVAVAMAPATSYAGAMIKEHECVGADTVLDKLTCDAGCTPIGSPIMPPAGNAYGPEDEDNFKVAESPCGSLNAAHRNLREVEGFFTTGALEVIPAPSGMFQSIPTIKEPGFLQAGFPATGVWRIGIKSSSLLSNLEIACSVCAERPQGLGPGETFAFFDGAVDEFQGSGGFIQHLNLPQVPWQMRATHICGAGNPTCSGAQPLNAVTIPGLIMVPSGEADFVEFLGCKPKFLVVENAGAFFRGDIVEVQIDVPASAALKANLDVTSCEVSYIRGCLPGEGAFKPICVGEP